MRSRISAFILAVSFLISSASTVRADVYGAVTGVVVNQANNAVQGATVVLKAEDSSPMTTRTDRGGHFNFARVPFDTYAVTVTASGYDSATNYVTVSTGNVVIVSFRLGVKTIGKVRVSGSSTVSGQPVSVNVISQQTINTLPDNQSLTKIVETAPGIVPFSYNEPVSRGFHGITYEIDGVPTPQTSGAYFSDIIDPRDISDLEVFTGSMPAEFGGQRQGAVVDVSTKRATDITGGDYGTVSLFGGSYNYGGASFTQSLGSGDFRAFLGGNFLRTDFGLDPPTMVPQNDNSNQNDGFMRLIYSPGSRSTLAFDYATQYAAFQIPINTNQNDPDDPNWSVPGTDDVQKESTKFANFTFNELSKDNQGYFEISPWFSSGRIQYLNDPAADLAGSSQSSIYQDRNGNFLGVATAFFRSDDRNSFKTGLQLDVENAASQFNVLYIDPTTGKVAPPFLDDYAQRGSNTGLYVEDKYEVTPALTVNGGLRWDASTGFVSGHQISPRIEANYQVNSNDIIHFWYGRLYAAPQLEDVRRAAVIIGGESSTALPVYDLKPERDSIYEAGLQHTFSPLTSGYITLWSRDVANVLDTTQIADTPLFTVFNSTQGQAQGVEVSIRGRTPETGNSYYVSYGESLSQAYGISGGTFLFTPAELQGANSWALEDHDQTVTINSAYTWNLRPGGRYATLQTIYGDGFPVEFENGTGRLPVHWEVNMDYGQNAAKALFGWELDADNILNNIYLIKLDNGFNSTQYSQGRQIILKLTTPVI
jgi:outer membrane receptor protein involved in Fe transport